VTLAETTIAAGLMMTVTGSVFTLLSPAQGTFQAQVEAADRLQRLRVGVDALTQDLLMAEAVWAVDSATIGLRHTSSEGEAVTRTYSLGAGSLMRGDGSNGNLPVVDHITGLSFEYVVGEPPCIQRVRVWLRVLDEEIQFDVTPRNLTQDPPTCSSLP
jgi:hypothetical protein